MSCTTQKASVPLASLTPCQRLEVVEEALYGLASGKTKVRIEYGDYRVEYGTGSVAFLERERARLQALCGKRSAITIGRTDGGWL